MERGETEPTTKPETRLRVVPVLDLLRGQVVRGVAGRREEYRPVVSSLTPSREPRTIARAFRDHFGLTTLYLADLDAIAGGVPALATFAELRHDGFRLWVDAGIRRTADAAPLADAGVEGLVAGLETLTGPAALRELCGAYGDWVLFSLDLKGGVPLGDGAAWGTADARRIAERAVECGVRRMIVLDLARVGVGVGTGTEEFCRWLTQTYPSVEVIAGGGVRDAADLRQLAACGVRAALVASALHDGRLRREDLDVP
jgi:phosphoribosylformimino-5-aminoimidazole carboxamide ribotide isomerase